MSPYRTTIANVVKMFSGTPDRNRILNGLLDFREKIRDSGINQGFQWIAGSFMEDCEGTRGRPPGDVDVVTFARRPISFENQAEWDKFVRANLDIFNREKVKADHKCDAFYVDLLLPPELIVSRSRYWFGLFSHQRSTYLWKGMLEISLDDDDATARTLLAGAN
jgi:hypothetical protein